MEVDADAALDGFLSEKAEVRKRAGDALERWRLRDPGGLVVMLATRIAGAACEGRSLAAVLLRKVLLKSGSELAGPEGGDLWCRPDLGEVLLEALASSVADPEVRGPAADAVATAASIQFAQGRMWPELIQLLARWCPGGRGERSATLRILENLCDESDDTGRTSTFALLALVEKHGNALYLLLEAALRDNGDESARDSAARIYTQCVVGAQALAPIREALRDLAAVVAEAAVTPSLSSTAPVAEFERDTLDIERGHDGCDGAGGDSGLSAGKEAALSEACLHAAALAARADPTAWSPLAVVGEASFAKSLMSVVRDPRINKEVRSAALAALIELTVAVHLSLEHAGEADGAAAIADELAEHAAKATAALLSELPLDEATDEWAEAQVVDGETEPGDGEGSNSDSLLEAVLDATERLANLPSCSGNGVGGGVAGLAAAAQEFLTREAWQGRHAALLIFLRLAFVSGGAVPDGAAAKAATTALGHFSHVQPRVRWAALEVWARLLATAPTPEVSQPAPSQEEFAQAFESLVAIVNNDTYMRVRRHGLLVFVAAASSATPPFTAVQLRPLFQNVLIPQVASPNVEVQEACATIARSLTNSCSEQNGSEAEVAALWGEFCTAASAAGQDLNSELEGGNSSQIEWPADWR